MDLTKHIAVDVTHLRRQYMLCKCVFVRLLLIVLPVGNIKNNTHLIIVKLLGNTNDNKISISTCGTIYVASQKNSLNHSEDNYFFI